MVRMNRSHLFLIIFIALVIASSYILFNRRKDKSQTSNSTSFNAGSPTPLSPSSTDGLSPEQLELFNKHKLGNIKLPQGFRISVFAEVPTARSLVVSPRGVVYVGNRENGSVYALVDENQDGVAERMLPLTTNLHVPNGVAFKDGDLYVTTIDTVYRLNDVENDLSKPPQPEVVYDGFPSDEAHGWKFTAFGPDGRLYIPVGVPCNSCLSSNPLFGTIAALDVSSKKVEIVAKGLRNSVGFDWRPSDDQLWFTDNGRDRMGDDVPGDELNRLSKIGEDFGAPYCYGNDVQDPDISPQRPCADFTKPVQVLAPHTAALGMRFYTGKMFPPEYKNQIFIAEHGSWNRTVPIGYRVMLVRLDGDRAVSYEPFAEGWLGANGEAFGRPVDVAVAPDGALSVSDDRAGAVYRIFYTGN
jgi:glucose/arabinose dehydrogenase